MGETRRMEKRRMGEWGNGGMGEWGNGGMGASAFRLIVSIAMCEFTVLRFRVSAFPCFPVSPFPRFPHTPHSPIHPFTHSPIHPFTPLFYAGNDAAPSRGYRSLSCRTNDGSDSYSNPGTTNCNRR